MLLSLLWTQLFSPAWAQIAGPGHFFFQWPTQTSQCQLVSLTWEDAVPPFSAWVIPLGQQPFIYDIPDSAYSGGSGQYDIQLQLNQGTNYVMLMSDGRGMGSGGTSNTQIVSSSPNTQCLDTAASNQTAKEFSFSVAGIARQCETGFELTWDGTPENAPYNFTVIPLQQGYYPFDVPISESSGWTKDWAVNMTEGTKFTVVMNNEHGYGTGGAAGIYEIANNTGGSSSCIQQSLQPTAVWPVGVATNTLPVATNSRRPGDNDSTGGGLAPGAIAGIVIGIIAVLALIAFLVWFIRRRKRRNADDYRGKEHNNLDLADGASDRGAGGFDDPLPADHGTVSPYISQNHTALPGESHSMTATPHRSDSGNRSENSASGFAGLGAASAFGAAAGGSGERSRQGSGAGMGHEPARDSWTYSHGDSMGGMGGMNMGYAMEDGDARAGPGIAPPLPPKGTPFRPSSSQPSTITGRPDSGYTQFTHHSNSMGHASKRDSSQTLQSRLGFGAGFGQTGSGAAPQLPPGAGAVGPGMPGVPGPNRGGMRIVNHDHPDDLPAVDPTAGGTSGNGTAGASGHGRRGQRNSDDFNNRRMEFRRHADAGRVDYVDLPPLYTDVPRDGGDAAVMRGPAQMEDMRGSSYGSGNSASPLPSADLRGGGGMSGNESPTSPHTPLLADVDPLSVNDPAGRGSGNGQRRSPLSR